LFSIRNLGSVCIVRGVVPTRIAKEAAIFFVVLKYPRLRAREQLRQGASQIKLMAGGGVNSPYNPIESVQYTEDEIHAAVEAADNWGTYVTVHAIARVPPVPVHVSAPAAGEQY